MPPHLQVLASAPPPAILHVVVTRADAVRVAPVFVAVRELGNVRQVVVDASPDAEDPAVLDVLKELGVPSSRVRAARQGAHTGASSVTVETASALAPAEVVLAETAPMVVVVSGATDTALAWTLTATKLKIPVARLDAGLRSFDWNEPSELNRVLMDTMGDALFAPTADAAGNLGREGISAGRICHTGCSSVDSLRRMLPRARARAAWSDRGLLHGSYVLMTLRRSNSDDDERLARIVEAIAALAQDVPVVLPLNPAVRDHLEVMGDVHRLVAADVCCELSLSYLDSLSLLVGAGAVITDSGTMQDESSVLGIPCFTLRAATDRSVTLTHGTNALLGADPRDISDVRLRDGAPTPCAIPLWDGRAGARIAQELIAAYALERVPRAS